MVGADKVDEMPPAPPQPVLLWHRAHFAAQPSTEQVCVSVIAAFCVLFLLEWALFALYTLAARHMPGPILAPRASRVKLGRRTLETISMSVLTALGLQAHERLGGFAAFGPLHGADAVARALQYDPLCARIALAQLCYQVFNTYISVRDRDGAIFVGHHIATGMLCVFAQAPFLLPFAPFFLGLTEFSTVLLCMLATFDPSSAGVPGMGERFPVTTKVLGVSFALVFIAVRIVAWPWMSFHFWNDVLAVLEARAHSQAVSYTFLVVNAGLSLLQLIWLGEIVQTALVLFGKPKDQPIGLVASDKAKAS